MIIIIPLFIIICVIAWWLRPQKNIPKYQKYAMLSVILTSLVLAICAVVFQLSQNTTGNIEEWSVSNYLFVSGIFLICAAILSTIFFAVTHKREIVKGIGFSICIAVIISIIELVLLVWLGGE
jgi:hypothetical protein